MPKPSDNPRLSSTILSRLDELRRLLRRYVTVHGTLLIVLWLLLTFWLGGLIDYLPVTVGSSESPRALRIGLLVVMVAGSLWIAWRWIVVRLLGRPANRSLALLLERHYPELNNELITAVELSSSEPGSSQTGSSQTGDSESGDSESGDSESGDSESGDSQLGPISNPAAHRAMLDRVHRSATERIALVRPSELFNWRPLWAAGTATLFGVLLTVAAAVSMPDWIELWSKRLFTLADDPWPRRAVLRADGLQLQVPAFSNQLSADRVWVPFVDGVARVPQGAAPMLQVSAGAGAPQVPEICTLYYRTDDGSRGRANLRRVGGPRDAWQPFTIDGPPLDGLTQNIHLDVVGLDARLRDLTIEVVDPAVIAGMQLICQYPTYLLDSLSVRAQQETLEYRSGIFIPEGTNVTLSGTASGPLSRVDYLIQSAVTQETRGQGEQDDTAESAGRVHSLECTDATFQIPLGKVAHTQVVEVRLIDQFGLSSAQIPRYSITVREDTTPEVTSQLEGIGLGITPTAMLPIVGTVVDDYGVQSVHAEVVVNEGETIALPLELGEDELKSTLDLDQLQQQGKLQLMPGATLGLVVTASDHYDLGPQPHVGRGQPLQLSVVTPDQLLVMLDRQELELRQRLEQIISELEQLREVLQTLKNDLPQAAAQFDGQGRENRLSNYILVAAQQEATRETRAEQTQRLAGLWAQQSVLQADKSQQELSSVAARVENLRQQLVNNRVDSYDRQERLLSKVGLPLRELLASEYRVLQRSLANLQSATLAGGGAQPAAQPTAAQSSAALDAVLLKLDEIKSNMQDIEDFNEIVDLVRGLLDDQEKILTDTEQEQRKRILDLLK